MKDIDFPKEPLFLTPTDEGCAIWENRPPAWKDSSTKGGRSEKQIKKDRKKKKHNRKGR